MKSIIIVLFLLFCSSTAWSYGYTVTGCPASQEVEARFNWYLNSTNTYLYFSTNNEGRPSVASYAYGVAQDMRIKGISNATGTMKVSWSGAAGAVMSGWSCVAVPVTELSKNISLMLGGICAMAFALAVGSRI